MELQPPLTDILADAVTGCDLNARCTERFAKLRYKVGNAPVSWWPCPHFDVPDVFGGGEFTGRLRESFPPDLPPLHESGRVTQGSYDRRKGAVLDVDLARSFGPEWEELFMVLFRSDCAGFFCAKFKAAIEARLGPHFQAIKPEILAIEDAPGYAIGPHTDHPRRLMSAFIYLDGTEGTQLFWPKDEEFRCRGGPHHSFDRFNPVYEAPSLPGSMFCFVKTAASFHGRAETGYPRRLVLYNLLIDD
ncbi:MAG: hypothetical protein ACREUV_10790 [Burkholderiales bacterium]